MIHGVYNMYKDVHVQGYTKDRFNKGLEYYAYRIISEPSFNDNEFPAAPIAEVTTGVGGWGLL